MDIVDLFARNAAEAAATVERIPAESRSLHEALLKATEGDDRILLMLSGDVDAGLFSLFRNDARVLCAPTGEDFRTVRTGVTDAFGAVASTGSVCIGVSQASPATMLTRKHIAVVDARTIVLRPRDILSEEYLEGKGLKRSFSFVTGPSATADMGPLVRGVHGPGQLHIIVAG